MIKKTLKIIFITTFIFCVSFGFSQMFEHNKLSQNQYSYAAETSLANLASNPSSINIPESNRQTQSVTSVPKIKSTATGLALIMPIAVFITTILVIARFAHKAKKAALDDIKTAKETKQTPKETEKAEVSKNLKECSYCGSLSKIDATECTSCGGKSFKKHK